MCLARITQRVSAEVCPRHDIEFLSKIVNRTADMYDVCGGEREARHTRYTRARAGGRGRGSVGRRHAQVELHGDGWMEGLGNCAARRGGVDVRVRTPNQPSEGGEARQDEGKTEVGGNREWGPNAEEEQARPRSLSRRRSGGVPQCSQPLTESN